MSIRAVQRRAASQKLEAKREGNRLLILVECRDSDASSDAEPSPGVASEEKQEEKRRDSDVSEVEFLRSQLIERDAQIRALLRIVDEDRDELRRLRAQLAIPEAPAVDPDAAGQDEKNSAASVEPDLAPVADTSMKDVGAPVPASADHQPVNQARSAQRRPEATKRGFWAKVIDVLLLRD